MKRLLSLLCCAALATAAAGCAAQNEPTQTTTAPLTTAASTAPATTTSATTAPDTTAPTTIAPTTGETLPAAGELTFGGLAETFAETLETVGYTGMAFAAENGAPLYEHKSAQGYGSDAVYRIASISKQFTAAAVLLLEAEGKLSVDDTLDKYFPDYTGGDTVRIHHLLCMRSGITDFVAAAQAGDVDIMQYHISILNSASENRAEMLRWIMENTTPAPDVRYSYSNSDYFLLAEIIEQASGKPYESYILQRILKPLGMTHTGFCDKHKPKEPIVESEDVALTSFNGIMRGSGDMASSADDLVLWANEFINGRNRVLTDEMIARMTTDYSDSGYGYGVVPDQVTQMISHKGNLPPLGTYLAVDPATGFVLVLFDHINDTAVFDAATKLTQDYVAARANS